MKILSAFAKIANVKKLIEFKLDIPNPILNIGLFNEEMGSLPQKKMLDKTNLPEINLKVDTSYNNVTGKGEIFIPVTMDNYLGEDW